jgi:phosphoribosylanthranilate isomerase
MFRIKICGVTQAADIDAVAAAGADAVGLNFHPPSIRFVSNDQAAALSALAAAAGLTRVGVFVDATADQIKAIVDAVGLDFAQLHGQQTRADIEQLKQLGCDVIRVVRLPVGKIDADTVRRSVAPWQTAGCPLLLDAEAGSHGGGLGLRMDWAAVGQWAHSDAQTTPWGLAGGLTPESVGEAIKLTGCRSIDVASGVESPRGKKSQPQVAAFVAAAIAAWDHAS